VKMRDNNERVEWREEEELWEEEESGFVLSPSLVTGCSTRQWKMSQGISKKLASKRSLGAGEDGAIERLDNWAHLLQAKRANERTSRAEFGEFGEFQV
jgi:hypothetical protein